MLNVCSLNFGFTKKRILRSLSFSLKKGETLQLKGSNGSGKTTLCKILGGLICDYHGTVFWQSSPTARKDPNLKPYLSYLASENNGLFPELSAYENMNYLLRLRNIQKKKKDILEILEEARVAPGYFLETLAVRKFSTGMKRRLALLRCFSLNTPLIILDEPTSGLDESGIQLFKSLLKDHTSRGGMTMIVSHDLDISQIVPTKTLDLSPKIDSFLQKRSL